NAVRRAVPPPHANKPPSLTGGIAQKVFTGGASRSLAQAILYPVDAMRTLAQTRDGKTLADLGTKALTKGCFTTSSFALFQGAIQFGIFGACRERVGPVVASALGAACSCLVSVPQEVIKQRLVTGVYTSFRDAVQTIYQTEGVQGFYSSWKPTMTRNVPFVITTFTTQDFLKRHRLKGETDTELSFVENIAIGMSSALVGGILTNPVDVVKTRMMTQAASTAIPYSSALDCFVTILRKEGPMTFYSGFKQRSIYMCGLWGITFALNGHFNKQANSEDEKKEP
ncbi:unnamed protein product, partial [Heterosigma akashiwo]